MIDILVPYFAEGLRSNEFCMWVTSEPLEVDEAKAALQKAVPNLEEYLKSGQIEIISYSDWYLIGGKFDSNRVLQGWVEKEQAALNRGFEGLRLTGNTFWIERELWNSFVDYEEAVNSVIGQHRMLALCTYCLKNCTGTDILDVVRNHVGTLVKQDRKWILIEDAAQRKKAHEEISRLASFPAINPNPVVEVDFEGKVQYANSSANTSFPDLKEQGVFHPFFADWEHILKTVKAKSEDTFGREHKIGDHYYYQQFFLVPKDKRLRVYAVKIDGLKHAESRLRESEQRWATTVSSIGDAVIATDVEGNVTFMNSVAEALTGWKLEEAKQKPLKDSFKIINEFTRKEVESPVTKVIEEGAIVGLANHTILVRKDGSEVPIDDSAAPIKDKEGNVTGVVLVFRDITERKKAEDALCESELKFRTVANFTYDWEYWIAPDGKIVYISPSCESFTGYSPEEFIKDPQLLTKIIHPEDKAQLGGHFDLLSTNEPHSVDFRIIKRNGEVRWVSHACQPVFDDDGKRLGRRASNRDITERKKAEEALTESQRRLSRSQEIAHLGSWELDLTTNALTWSDEVYRIFGLEPQEFAATYEAFLDRVHPDDRAVVDAAYAGSIKEGRDNYAIEHRVVRKSNGEIRIVHEKCEHIRDKNGKIVRSIGMVQDITERKQIEQSLYRAKVDWERTFNSVPDLIAILDGNHRIIRANKAMAETLSTTPEKCIGLNCYRCVHGTNAPPDNCPHSKAIRDGQEHTEEVHEEHLGGDFLVTATPLKDEHGGIIGSVHVARNITERKEMENELRETLHASLSRQSEVSALLEASKAVLIHREFGKAARVIFDSCKNLLGATAGYVALLSKDEKENKVLFLDAGELPCTVNPSLPMPIRGLRAEAYITGKAVYCNDFTNSEWASLMPKGHVTLNNVLFAPLTIDNKTVGIIGLANKVNPFTERDAQMASAFGEIASIALINSQMLQQLEVNEKLLKAHSERLEHMVAEKTKQLRDSERLAAIGATAGMVGHDIRNPLQAITGDLYLAKEEMAVHPDNECKESVLESLSEIEKNVEYINKIVADLQDFARPLNPTVTETSLKGTIDELVNNPAIPKNIQIHSDVAKGAETIMADSAYLKRVLSNLVNNAIQAMPQGGTLTVQAYTDRKDVVVTVADTGVGIPEEAKDKLFTPLFTTKSKGQGFGLAVVKRMTEALGGTVAFESEPNKGTKFTIRLPKRMGIQ